MKDLNLEEARIKELSNLSLNKEIREMENNLVGDTIIVDGDLYSLYLKELESRRKKEAIKAWLPKNISLILTAIVYIWEAITVALNTEINQVFVSALLFAAALYQFSDILADWKRKRYKHLKDSDGSPLFK